MPTYPYPKTVKVKDGWVRTTWGYNDAPKYAAWECWTRKFENCHVTIYPCESKVPKYSKGWFRYVFSHQTDPNYEGSHSGMVQGATYEEAMKAMEGKIASREIW